MLSEEVRDWATYTLTGLVSAGGALVTGYFAFRLKSRKQDEADFKTILNDLRGRINKLETMVDDLQREHTECKATAAKLQAELDAIKAATGRGPSRFAKGSR